MSQKKLPRIRLVDVNDSTHVLHAEIVSRRLHVVTIRYTFRHGRMFRPAGFWEAPFDVRSGLQLSERGAFRIHEGDLAKLKSQQRASVKEQA